MKLLFVSQVPASRLMGVPRVLYCIGDELQSRGHTVDYFFEEDAPRPLIKQAALMEWAMRAAPRIGRLCRQKKYDAVVITTASGWVLSTFRGMLLPKNTRIVSWHHGFEELMWQQMAYEEQLEHHRFTGKFKSYYASIMWANRQSLETQDAALFTSTEERDWVRQKYPKQAHKALYQPNGVSGAYYYPERFDHPAPGKLPSLLFVGYWDPWRKGRRYLVDAFTQLHARHPELRLTLAGTKLTAEQILPDFPPEVQTAVTVIPHLDEAESIAIYREHDIFLLPALFEGMPLVVLEAMAAAMPVITSNSNGMRDLIHSGDNGFLVERRDVPGLVAAVERLIEYPELRERLGLAAYETASRLYTWRQVSDIFEESMFRVIHGKLKTDEQQTPAT